MAANKAPAGHFTILYFAGAASFTRKHQETIRSPLPLDKLSDTLEKMYPGIRSSILSSCAVTMNLEYVDIDDDSSDNTFIQEGDEVALIPPVSSG